jgi:hypothetical protein
VPGRARTSPRRNEQRTARGRRTRERHTAQRGPGLGGTIERGTEECRFDDLSKLLRQAETTTNGAVTVAWVPEARYHFFIYGTTRHQEDEHTIELHRNRRIDAQVGLDRRPPGDRSTLRVRVTGRFGTPVGGARVQVLIPDTRIVARAARVPST